MFQNEFISQYQNKASAIDIHFSRTRMNIIFFNYEIGVMLVL